MQMLILILDLYTTNNALNEVHSQRKRLDTATSVTKKELPPVICMTWGQLLLLTVQMINPSGDFGGDRIIPYNFTPNRPS